MKNKKKKTIIIAVVSVLLILGCAALAIGIFGNKSKDVSPSFSHGALDENGAYIASETTLYTKDLVECRGLSVVPDFENDSEYQIFWYNEDGIFLSSEERTDKAFTGAIPKLAKYCRIVLYPVIPEDADEDYSISFWDISKYASLINVSVDRYQNYSPENFYETSKLHTTKEISLVTGVNSEFTFIKNAVIDGYQDGAESELIPFTEGLKGDMPDGYNVIKIYCADTSKYIIRFNDICSSGKYYAFFYDADGNAVKPAYKINAVEGDSVVLEVPETAKYVCINTFPNDLEEGGKDIPIVINEYLPR